MTRMKPTAIIPIKSNDKTMMHTKLNLIRKWVIILETDNIFTILIEYNALLWLSSFSNCSTLKATRWRFFLYNYRACLYLVLEKTNIMNVYVMKGSILHWTVLECILFKMGFKIKWKEFCSYMENEKQLICRILNSVRFWKNIHRKY